MEEPLVDEGEVDSKVTVGRGNNQVGKEQDKANIAEKTNEAEKAKEDNKVRVHGGVGDRDVRGFNSRGTGIGHRFGGAVGDIGVVAAIGGRGGRAGGWVQRKKMGV